MYVYACYIVTYTHGQHGSKCVHLCNRLYVSILQWVRLLQVELLLNVNLLLMLLFRFIYVLYEHVILVGIYTHITYVVRTYSRRPFLVTWCKVHIVRKLRDTQRTCVYYRHIAAVIHSVTRGTLCSKCSQYGMRTEYYCS